MRCVHKLQSAEYAMCKQNIDAESFTMSAHAHAVTMFLVALRSSQYVLAEVHIKV